MNSRVSWSVDGIDPSVRERAEAAARRAGMSLNDWLNSTLGETAPPNFRGPYDQQPRPEVRCRATRRAAKSPTSTSGSTRSPSRSNRFQSPRRATTLHDRTLRDQTSRASRASPASSTTRFRGSMPGCRRSPSRSTSARPAPALETRQRQADAVERAAAQVYRNSPPLSPASFDVAVAEITARQSELDGSPPRQMPPRAAPSIAPGSSFAPRWRRPRLPTRRRRRSRGRISRRSNAICSRSRARSSRCSALTIPSRRSTLSAASLPRSATPSPKRCRAARSNRSRTRSARCIVASTRPARPALMARCCQASSTRWPTSSRCCAR